MQPYFDPTRKTATKKNGRRTPKKKWKMTSKKIKMEDDLKKMKMEEYQIIFFGKTKMTISKKMENYFFLKRKTTLKKIWKTT
jgi:hypothetical protein